MAAYTYKEVVNNLPDYYEETFEERHGRDHDGDVNYNGDYWISAAEYIEDLEERIKDYKSLVNLEGGEAIDKLIELSNKEVWN